MREDDGSTHFSMLTGMSTSRAHSSNMKYTIQCIYKLSSIIVITVHGRTYCECSGYIR